MSGREHEPPSLPAVDSLFDKRDRENVRNYARFVAGAVKRHGWLVLGCLLFIVGGAAEALWALPKTYHVEAKSLAQRNSALTVRGDGPGADSLTRVAAETILRRDNLVALIHETDLVHYMQEHRSPAQRAKYRLLGLLHVRPDSDADQLDGMVELLEKRLNVWTGENGSTVTIAIDWTDAPMACRLVDASQRAFLEARYAGEVTALSESIDILKGHTTNLKADVDDAVDAIEKLRAGRTPQHEPGPESDTPSSPPPAAVTRMLSPGAPREAPVDTIARQLKIEIDAKQRAIDELEEFRRRTLSDLQAKLMEARTTFTESHPAIVDLKQSIAALSVDSPQLTTLRQELGGLRAEYARRSPDVAPAPASGATPTYVSVPASQATPPRLPSDVLRLDFDMREDRDPAMVYARGRLHDAMDKYASLRSQIETSQIDLETARAAFKYRYSVVTPAQMPKGPVKPKAPIVLGASLLAALLCGVLLAVLVDLRSGRLIERWQLEQILDRPILAELSLPAYEAPDGE